MTPLVKGGSGREFYRIRFIRGVSVILIQYTLERRENARYAEISEFLHGTGVQVPRVYFHQPESGLILMEDLGEEDLWFYRSSSWEIRRPLYQSALSQAFLIHQRATEKVKTQNLRMELEFNEQLYFWEQNYFFENCVKGVWGLEAQILREIPALSAIAVRLASLPRMLVHRDFQSQNILISLGSAWLIDFQGMRPGLGLYDVASLLYDPYVRLTESEQQELLEFYKGLWAEAGSPLEDGFETIFLMCALQRLMQALGAYGYLALTRKRPDFLLHIPIARQSLRAVALRLGGLDPLVEILDKAEKAG